MSVFNLGVRPFCFLHWNMARLVLYIVLYSLQWNLAVWMLYIPLVYTEIWLCECYTSHWLHWNLAVWMLYILLVYTEIWLCEWLDIQLVYTEIWLCECYTSYWLHWNLAVWMLHILLFTLKSDGVNAIHNTALHWLKQVLTGYIIGAAMILRLVF